MNLDIRIPIGLLFVILGLLLVGYGLATTGDAALYQRSLDVNINLWWGIAMLIFGGLMCAFGFRKGAAPPPAAAEGEPGRPVH